MRTLLLVGVAALLLAGGGAAVIALQPKRRLYHLDTRGAGIDPQLVAFLRWWERNGRFAIVVVTDGGVRTAADQLRLYERRVTDASTLQQAPHAGRVRLVEEKQPDGTTRKVARVFGQAVDVAPYEQNAAGLWAPRFPQPNDPPAEVARIEALFTEIGEAGERAGLTWGGRWRTKTFPRGDLGHLETPDWRQLPLPSGGVA